MALDFQFESTKFEESWSRQALEAFYEDGWIQGVLYRVKGGKEATVYCCQADPATGYDMFAAKIYRHRSRNWVFERAISTSWKIFGLDI